MLDAQAHTHLIKKQAVAIANVFSERIYCRAPYTAINQHNTCTNACGGKAEEIIIKK